VKTQLIDFILFGCFLVANVAIATTTSTRVTCRKFQRYHIGIGFNYFIVESEN